MSLRPLRCRGSDHERRGCQALGDIMPLKFLTSKLSEASAVPVFKLLGLSSFSGVVATSVDPDLVTEVGKVPTDIGLIVLSGLCVIAAFWSADRNRKTADKQADGMASMATEFRVLSGKIQRVVYIKPGHREEDIEEVGHIE